LAESVLTPSCCAPRRVHGHRRGVGDVERSEGARRGDPRKNIAGLARQLAQVRKSGKLDFLRPDGKTQVTLVYEDDVPVRVTFCCFRDTDAAVYRACVAGLARLPG